MSKTAELEAKIAKAKDTAVAAQGRLVKISDDIARAIRSGLPELPKLRAERAQVQNQLSDLREQIGVLEAALPAARRDDARPAFVKAVADLDAAAKAQVAAFARVAELERLAVAIHQEMAAATAGLKVARDLAAVAGEELGERPLLPTARIDAPAYQRLVEAVRLIERIGPYAEHSEHMRVRALAAEQPRPKRQTVAERLAARA